MLRRLLICFSFIYACVNVTYAQDSVKTKLPALRTKADRLLNKSTPSPNISPPALSIATDSTSQKVQAYTNQLASSKANLTSKIDSLKSLNLPTDKYQHKLDSLSKINPLLAVQQQEARIKAGIGRVTGSITNAKEKLFSKIPGAGAVSGSGINGAQLPVTDLSLPGASLPASSLPNVSVPSVSLPDASLPGTSLPNANLPNASLPTANIPRLPTDGVAKEIKSITDAPAKEIGDLKNSSEVKSVTSDVGAFTKAGEKAAEIKKDAAGIVKGDQQSIGKVSDKLENEVKNNGDLKDLTGQTKQLDEVKKLAEVAESPEALQAKAIEEAKKQAVNHFAGKEQILRSAMDKVSKYKQKYSSLSSLSEIPKRIPNEMKGKPFIERVLPGISFQVMRSGSFYRIDLNPWVGFRLTGHITLGAGWNERIGFHHFYYNGRQHVYGPRAFGEYRIGKGYWARLEVETMNTYIPPNQKVFDPQDRRWIWGSFVGLKKRYKIYKNFYGTAQMLYSINSLVDKHHINVYADPLTARIGFEFPRKAKNSALVQ